MAPIMADAPSEKVKEYLRARERLSRASAKKLNLYLHDPVAFIADCVQFPEGEFLTPYQEDICELLVENKRLAVKGPHGLGKLLLVSEPIPTPGGWTTMGELKEGDLVFNEKGQPVRVSEAHEPRWHPCYRMTFSDGTSMVAGKEHLWSAIDVGARKKGPKTRDADGKRHSKMIPVSDWRDEWDQAKTVDTAHLAATLRMPSGQFRWRIPLARPLDLPEADLPIDPYIFGMWLGDGTSAKGQFTSGEKDLPHLLQALEGVGYEPVVYRYPCDPEKAPHINVKPLTNQLRSLGVLGNKHIPNIYLRSSVEQRRELVRGLWDSDGYRQGHKQGQGGTDEITLCNKTLIDGVVELLHSLGLSVRVHESEAKLNGRVTGPRWRVGVRFDFNPYKLERYDWAPAKRQASRFTQRTLVSVEPIGDHLARCIAVDSPRHLFLAGEAMIPTHNTTSAALLIHWFALTRDALGIDWKVPITAGAWRQLEQFLMPEVHKWAKALRWDRIGRECYTRDELKKLNLDLGFGRAFAVASNVPAYIEGAHADHILYVFDESKSIIDGTFDAAEGAFSGAGSGGREAYALASSTPGEPIGRFYDLHMQKEGYKDWHPRSITLQETIAAGRNNQEWADNRKLQWGEDSQMYHNRVLGEFYASDVDSIIPLSWIEAAVERWYETRDAAAKHELKIPPLERVGVDVARSGSDKTVIARIRGLRVEELQYSFHEDTTKTEARVKMASADSDTAIVTIDADGVGAGVYDHVVKALGKDRVKPFHAAEATTWRDISGELEFLNTRAAAWWNLRQLLDPTKGASLELPDDDQLAADLTAPRKKETGRGKLQVESKDEVKKRTSGRSTDAADAVIMGLWVKKKRRRRRMTFAGRAQ